MIDYTFLIRKAVAEDAAALKEIMQESFNKYIEDTGLPGTMEALDESYDDIVYDIKNKEVYIAFVDGEAVGSVRVELYPDNTAYITRFGVKLSYHSMGIGKSLMSIVDKLLTTKGIKRVSLHTASKYYALVRFYYGRGFYVDSTTKDRGYTRALMVKEYS